MLRHSLMSEFVNSWVVEFGQPYSWYMNYIEQLRKLTRLKKSEWNFRVTPWKTRGNPWDTRSTKSKTRVWNETSFFLTRGQPVETRRNSMGSHSFKRGVQAGSWAGRYEPWPCVIRENYGSCTSGCEKHIVKFASIPACSVMFCTFQ